MIQYTHSGGNIRYVEIHRGTLAISHHIVEAPQPGVFTYLGLEKLLNYKGDVLRLWNFKAVGFKRSEVSG